MLRDEYARIDFYSLLGLIGKFLGRVKTSGNGYAEKTFFSGILCGI